MSKEKDSSIIESVSYDSGSKTLTVYFKGKKPSIFEYYNVDPDEADSFKEAKSKGSYFHKYIKNNYKSNRV